MRNRTIFIVLIVFVVIAFVIVYVNYKDGIQNQQDEEKSTLMSEHLRNYFSNGKNIRSYPYQESVPNWNNDYLLLEHTGDNIISVRYSTRWNKEAGTNSHFPGDDANGLIVIETLHRVVGSYESSLGAGGSEQAIQRSYVLHYFDTATETVIGRDTLFGPRPSTQSSTLDSSVGELPSDKDVIERIRRKTSM